MPRFFRRSLPCFKWIDSSVVEQLAVNESVGGGGRTVRIFLSPQNLRSAAAAATIFPSEAVSEWRKCS